MKTTALTIALALAAATTTLAAPITITDKGLATVLDAHVKTLQARDLAALEKTITSGDALDLILPNGKRMTTRKEDGQWRLVHDQNTRIATGP